MQPDLYWITGTFMVGIALTALAWAYISECCVTYRPRSRGPQGGRWDR